MSTVEAIMQQVERLRVPQMKEVLKQLRERVGGNRADLVARIRFVCEQRSVREDRLAEVASIVANVGGMTPVAAPSPRGLSGLAAVASSASSTVLPRPTGLAANTATSFASNRSAPGPGTVPGFSAHPFALFGGSGRPSINLSGFANAPTQPLGGGPKPPVESLRFRNCPFYSSTTRLMMKSVSCDTGKASFKFPLNAEHINRVFNGGEVVLLMVGPENGQTLKPNPIKASGIPVEYPPLEGAHSNAPNHCHIFINNVPVPPVQYAGIRGKPWTAKALDMNKFLLKSSGLNNTIELRFTPAFRTIAVSIELSRPQSIKQIVEDTKRDTLLSRDVIIAERKHKASADDDICLTEEHVSLKDPVTRCRINVPARSRQCRHPQCFDLEYYLQLNQTHPTWSCPVCSKMAPINEVFVDGYFIELLAAATSDLELESAEIAPDGTWRLNKEEATGVASDDSDDDGPLIKREQATKKFASTSVTPAPVLSSSSAAQVIDLTLSDDDNAPPPPRLPPVSISTQRAPQQPTPADDLPAAKRPRTMESQAPNLGALSTLSGSRAPSFALAASTLSYNSERSSYSPSSTGNGGMPIARSVNDTFGISNNGSASGVPNMLALSPHEAHQHSPQQQPPHQQSSQQQPPHHQQPQQQPSQQQPPQQQLPQLQLLQQQTSQQQSQQPQTQPSLQQQPPPNQTITSSKGASNVMSQSPSIEQASFPTSHSSSANDIFDSLLTLASGPSTKQSAPLQPPREPHMQQQQQTQRQSVLQPMPSMYPYAPAGTAPSWAYNGSQNANFGNVGMYSNSMGMGSALPLLPTQSQNGSHFPNWQGQPQPSPGSFLATPNHVGFASHAGHSLGFFGGHQAPPGQHQQATQYQHQQQSRPPIQQQQQQQMIDGQQPQSQQFSHPAQAPQPQQQQPQQQDLFTGLSLPQTSQFVPPFDLNSNQVFGSRSNNQSGECLNGFLQQYVNQNQGAGSNDDLDNFEI
ncbi:hypothetical protein BC830DRAFT_1224163 [Chytriomyces sp. MP71]|nr:hypothetical protein BC830DRAFT_1224163 [Chytriomyces sp. MP71]